MRLCDFGLAMDLTCETPKSCVGTLDYMPPEARGSQPSDLPLIRLPAKNSPSCPRCPLKGILLPLKASLHKGGRASCYECFLSQMAEACLARGASAAAGSISVSYGLPADIWALGVLACELLTGASPFEGDTKEETYGKILDGEVWLPSHLSPEAQDFVRQVHPHFHTQNSQESLTPLPSLKAGAMTDRFHGGICRGTAWHHCRIAACRNTL